MSFCPDIDSNGRTGSVGADHGCRRRIASSRGAKVSFGSDSIRTYDGGERRQVERRRLRSSHPIFSAVLLLLALLVPPALAANWTLSGDLGAHDPSIIREGGTWWCFTTGSGLPVKSSPDGLHWTQASPLFTAELSWWRTYAPNMGQLDVWAPDVHRYNGRTWCYYCVSEFGQNNSAIGLTSCSSIAAGDWRDDGMVISSQSGTDADNAIDPDLAIDANGQPWLVFGSWFDGIHVVQLNPTTMKPTGTVYSIAQRANGIEGANIVRANGYYYLFVSIDKCCLGVNSTYKIAYGRSDSITGPYLAKDGTAMLEGGATVLASSGTRWIGPGGQSVVQNGGSWIIAYHAYDANDNGLPFLQISDLFWDANGWPTLTGPGFGVSTLAGLADTSGAVDGTGSAARFDNPTDVAADATGLLYVADTNNDTVRTIAPDTGTVMTLAGAAGVSGDADGQGTSARFDHPSGIAVDASGYVYVADTDNDTIRKISPSGMVNTLAGAAGVAGSADGPGSTARFDGPSGLALDADGNLYVADTLNHAIREITPAGMVSTLAGQPGTGGSADGAGTAARFLGPQGLAADTAGNLYVADTNNDTVRRIVLASTAVTTVAGQAGVDGDSDGSGTAARFLHPSGLTVGTDGDIYVTDTDNDTIRRVTPGGDVTTIAGQAATAGSADGLDGASRFHFPTGIIAAAKVLYVADDNNDTVRAVALPAAPAITQQPQSQTVTAGAGAQFSITATGQPAPTYQWYFNSRSISGATDRTLSLTSVQSSDAGGYSVAVTNSSGSVTSQSATLTVNPAPSGSTGSSSGGGGGGGVMGAWFAASLTLLILARRFSAAAPAPPSAP